MPAMADPICYADGLIPIPTPMFPIAIPVLDAYSSGGDMKSKSKWGVFDPAAMIIQMLKGLFASHQIASNAAALAAKLGWEMKELQSAIPKLKDMALPFGMHGVPKWTPKPFMRTWHVVPEIGKGVSPLSFQPGYFPAGWWSVILFSKQS